MSAIPKWAKANEKLLAQFKKLRKQGWRDAKIHEMLDRQVRKKEPKVAKQSTATNRLGLSPKEKKWRCPTCGGLIEVGHCLHCEIETTRQRLHCKM